MIRLAMCIAIDHDPWLVVLAVLICGVGAFSIVQMFERARGAARGQGLAWAFLISAAASATIWCTHFVAMLAFEAKAPVTLDPVLTIVSLMVAMIGCFAGFSVAARGRHDAYGAVGGALFGGAIAAMHFVGMSAYRVDGIVSWDMNYVIAAILCGVGLSAAAIALLRTHRAVRHRVPVATGLIVAAIALLHFLAMTAMRITPMALDDTPLRPSEFNALALATVLVGGIVIAAGVFAAMLDRQTRSEAMRELTRMAMSDALTGLPNRTAFRAELARQIEAATANGERVGLCAIDLDRFKEINDLHGHKAGDEVLARIAGRLQAMLGPDQFVARLGGDEFVAMIRFAEPTQLSVFAARLDTELKAPLALDDFEARLGASIGIAIFPDDAATAEALANNADLAMYRAKADAAPVPLHYDSALDEAIRDQRELAADLRRAIDKGELDVHYQVQTSVTSGAVTGYEALLRWTHPQRGAIPPAIFIPIAESNGFILALGEWVLRRACIDAAGWPHQSKVAVNVSPLQLAHADLPRLFHQTLLDTGLPPRRLEIELTETAIIADRERALHVLRQIKALGVGVALDDFGTGYSSLETLRAFPFDKIKLDRFFAAELEGNIQSTAILRAVLALGKSLSIPILAEGIETQEQLDVLRREGCDEAQGFLIGRPGRAAALAEAGGGLGAQAA
ncbi:MAG: putative bifunctional diguanylate cyclase/phosphodiesterase [Sphingopyxis sp.]|uniref:putative bifunctional diguanylate cyclase/phosphodiesterase n=1 Tax=Sphingopyxis sp. TaxID=1908224 RepID=UPI003D6D3DFF